LSKTRSVLSVILERNIAAMIILTGSAILLVTILLVPYLQDLFSFEFPGYIHFLPSLIGAFAILVIMESIKFFRFRKLFFD
jgi:Ca2+-transporting ATPase